MAEATAYHYGFQDETDDLAHDALERLSEYAPEVTEHIALDHSQDAASNRELLTALNGYDRDKMSNAIDDVATALTGNAPHLEQYMENNLHQALHEIQVYNLQHPEASSEERAEQLTAAAEKLTSQMNEPVTGLEKQLDGVDQARFYADINPIAFAQDYGLNYEQVDEAKARLEEHRSQLAAALKSEGVYRYRGEPL